MKAENYYYFIAEYTDGTQYEQGADDLSMQRSDKNSFYDIFYNPIKPLDTMIRFRLVPADPASGLSEFAVNLMGMHFEAGGGAFYPYDTVKRYQDGKESPLVLSNPRLIYTRIMEATATVNDKLERIGDSTLQCVGYKIGFQANDQDGDNHQFVMRI